MYSSSKRTLLVGFVLFLFCAVLGTPAFAAPAVSLTSAIYDDVTDVDFSAVRPGENITLTFTVTGSASARVMRDFKFNSTTYSTGGGLSVPLDDDGQITVKLSIPSKQQGTFTFYVVDYDEEGKESEKSNEITQQITTSDWTGETGQDSPQTSSPDSGGGGGGGGGCNAGFGMVLPILTVVFALLRKKR
jgi:hypothetical protein